MNATLTLANGVIGTGAAVGTDLKWIIFNIAIPLMCGLFVVVIGFRTRAPGPTLLAAVFAGIVWGLAAHMGALKDMTGDDIQHYQNAPSTIQGDL